VKKIAILVVLTLAISGYAFSENTFSLIEKSRQSPVLPIVFNILPGFGIGSYLQGDTEVGNIILVGESIATAMLVGGGLSYYFNNRNSDRLIEPVVCFSIGGLLYLGMKVFGIIEPIRFNNAKNKNEIRLLSTGNNLFISYSY
jgi:hypothetical protein